MDVDRARRRKEIMSGLENEHKLYFQIAAFKIIRGGHYIIGPKSNKVSAGNGMVILKLCYCKVLLRNGNFKRKSRKEETLFYIIYSLERVVTVVAITGVFSRSVQPSRILISAIRAVLVAL